MQNKPSGQMKSGTEDKIEGTVKNFAGAVKRDAGKVLGNPRLEDQGETEQARGNAQKKVGEIKKVFGQ
jgi:uncharacterized protein YjbJ (UPF0337 family)